jgi:hypothetical protein
VPLEKTAGFSSRTKAAHPKQSDEPKPVDEPQKEKKSESPTAVLLDIDQDVEADRDVEAGQDVEASTEAQIRDLLLSPGMADLTGIIFPREREIPLLRNPDFQGSIYPDSQLPCVLIELTKTAYAAQELWKLLNNCSGYIQDRAGRHGQLGSSQAANFGEFLVDRWSGQQRTAFNPPESALPEAAPTPSTPTLSQNERLALPKSEPITAELENDHLSESSIFDNYRTPPRSASATVTDSSDEKKQRSIDASLLSPKKQVVSSDIPTMAFESLRVSGGRAIRNAPGQPQSLIDMDAASTPSKQVVAKATAKPPILGSMERSMFASPANMPYQLNKAKVIGLRPSLYTAFMNDNQTLIDFPPHIPLAHQLKTY